MSARVSILGGGPAGASAALAAVAEGAAVQVIERARLPRHKVCGEFLSPEIEPELRALGVWDAFTAARPARVERVALCFGARRKEARLPEAAWGLSRYAFDALLLGQAQSAGAQITQTWAGPAGQPATVLACGRRSPETRRGRRQFGFKAHFEGPVNDAVELYFFDGCYAGVSAIEDGRTNVCGLGPEDFLARFHFAYDDVLRRSPALAERLAPLHRVIPWVSTGPLEYGQRFHPGPEPYPAGDALSFVDPFTGSGLLAAVRSGAIAGRAAARRETSQAYLAQCHASLKKPFQVASLLRRMVANGWAERLAGMAPPALLFALTRPR